jgi:hypothetical protein
MIVEDYGAGRVLCLQVECNVILRVCEQWNIIIFSQIPHALTLEAKKKQKELKNWGMWLVCTQTLVTLLSFTI